MVGRKPRLIAFDAVLLRRALPSGMRYRMEADFCAVCDTVFLSWLLGDSG